MAQWLLSTTGTASSVTISDLGRRSFVHPTVDFDLLTEFTHSQIVNSAGLATLVANGDITVKDTEGTFLNIVEDKSPTRIVFFAVDPVVTDDDTEGYRIGSLFVNTATNKLFYCRDNLTNNAVWEQIITTITSPDPDAIHDNIAGEISAITLKAAPIGADKILIEDSTDSDNKKYILVSGLPFATLSHTHTESEITDLSHTDIQAIHDNVANEISAIALKAIPVGNDLVLIEDSAAGNAKRRILLSSLPVPTHTHIETEITDLNHTDPNAIHDNLANEIISIVEKVTPTGNDVILIEDNAAANVKKRVQIGNLPGAADPDAIHDNVAGEISAITEKVILVDNDLIVIEDSADSDNKKKAKISSITAAVTATGFGAEYQYDESEAESTTTSGSAINKLTLTTTNLPVGTYFVGWCAEVGHTSISDSTVVEVRVAGALINNPRLEPKDINDWASIGASKELNLSGILTITIDFFQVNGTTAKIRSARAWLWRVA